MKRAVVLRNNTNHRVHVNQRRDRWYKVKYGQPWSERDIFLDDGRWRYRREEQRCRMVDGYSVPEFTSGRCNYQLNFANTKCVATDNFELFFNGGQGDEEKDGFEGLSEQRCTAEPTLPEGLLACMLCIHATPFE